MKIRLKIALAGMMMTLLHPWAGIAQTQNNGTNQPQTVSTQTDDKKEEFKPSGKVWGYAFGDYAYKVHADEIGRTTPGNQYGGFPKDSGVFDFRRVYFGFDYNISEHFSTQFLLAHESNLELSPDNRRVTYIKLANLRWKNIFTNTDVVFGQMETPGYPMLEERVWGYRSIEKTITDMRGIIPSTELGAAIQGRLNDKGDYGYNLMFSNGSGASPEGNIFKKLSADVYAKFMDQKIMIDVYGDYQLSQRQPVERNIATGKIFAAYQSDLITVGVTVFVQNRTNVVSHLDTANGQKVNDAAKSFGVSGFVRGRIMKDKLNYFLRYDSYDPDQNFNSARFYTATAGSAPNTEMFATAGLDFTPVKSVHIMPNVWYNGYSNRLTGTTDKLKSDYDLMARLTIYYVYGK